MPQAFHRPDRIVVAQDDSSNPSFFSGLAESVILTPLRYPLTLSCLPPREQGVARHCCVLETPSKQICVVLSLHCGTEWLGPGPPIQLLYCRCSSATLDFIASPLIRRDRGLHQRAPITASQPTWEGQGRVSTFFLVEMPCAKSLPVSQINKSQRSWLWAVSERQLQESISHRGYITRTKYLRFASNIPGHEGQRKL
jgi:hypothetical protein